MAILKTGTRCVIIAGCPENIGVIVSIVAHLGVCEGYVDAYAIQTVSGRPFQQLWDGGDLLRARSDQAITERYKLRPLVEPKGELNELSVEQNMPTKAL